MFNSIFYTGGPIFMYPLLVLLIVAVILFVKELVKNDQLKKTVKLLSALGSFAVVWGFLGQILGLMAAFEAISMAGDVSPSILAEGLRVSFYAPIFGMVVFLIAKLEVIILTAREK